MKHIQQVNIKDLIIPIKIKNYRNSKSIKIYFKEDILTITKSPYISNKKVEILIKKNEKKIYQEYKKIIVLKDEKTLDNSLENKTIMYNGENYKIVYKKHEKNNIKIYIDRETKTINIYFPLEFKEDKKYNEKIIKLIKNIFKQETENIINEKLPYWSKITDIKYNLVKIRDAKTRYGSCIPKKRTLNFTSRLIMLKDEEIDAVIVHELCHIIHPNHSKEFYKLVESYIPGYKEIDKKLKKNSELIMI